MKIGIKKLELVELSGAADFSFFSPGSTIPVDQFITGERKQFDFTPGTGTFEETWLRDTGGLLSEVIVTIVNRQQKDDVDNKFIKAQFSDKIAIVTLIDGRRKIVGSTSFPAQVTLTNSISGFEYSDKTYQISCRSTHGSYSGK